MNSKRIWAIAAFVLALSASSLTAAPGLGLDVNLGWTLDARVGAEIPFSPDFGLRAEIGASPFSLEGSFAMMYGLLGVWYFAHPGDSLDFGLDFGMPDAMTVFTEQGAHMFSFGGSLCGRWRFGPGLYATLRLGAGYPYFIEGGRGEWGGTSFFGLWPDARIGFGYLFPG